MVLRKDDGGTTSRSDFGRKQKIQLKGGSAPVASPAGSSSENYPKVKWRKSPYPLPAVSRSRLALTSTSSSSDCEDESKIPIKMKIKTCQTLNKKKADDGSGIETSQSKKGAKSNFLISVFERLPERWKNWIVRGVFGLLMVAGFSFIVYLGPVALVVLTLSIQVRCFAEVINIGYTIYKVANFPWYRFRSLSWYFLITSNYFFYMESSLGVGISSSVSALSSNFNQHSMYKTDDNINIDNNISDNNLYFKKTEKNPCSSRLVNTISNNGAFQFLTSYNRFISFWLYMIGFLWFFVSLSLAKKSKKYRGVQIESNQYNLFAFTHVSLLIVVAQSYLIIQNIFEGMIWFIVPVSMIVCNDAMAYFFGFFLGRTPLIKLSPKKTWEGYVGGGFATVIFGLFASHWICQYPFFTCPVEYTNSVLGMMPNLNCEVTYLFSLQDYAIPGFLINFGMSPTVKTYPFVLHSLALSIFSSVIGPFGGFFASGFKRAFKIKDFAAVIPGHGGVLDRFDCQFLMATFVNVYITSFIRQPSPERLLQQALDLKPEAQLDLLNSLGDHLMKKGLL